jgi:hypothetical protein
MSRMVSVDAADIAELANTLDIAIGYVIGSRTSPTEFALAEFENALVTIRSVSLQLANLDGGDQTDEARLPSDFNGNTASPALNAELVRLVSVKVACDDAREDVDTSWWEEIQASAEANVKAAAERRGVSS